MISLRFQLSVFLKIPTAIKSEILPNTFKGISSEIPSENPKQVLKNVSRHCSKNPYVTFQKVLTLREERFCLGFPSKYSFMIFWHFNHEFHLGNLLQLNQRFLLSCSKEFLRRFCWKTLSKSSKNVPRQCSKNSRVTFQKDLSHVETLLSSFAWDFHQNTLSWFLWDFAGYL